MGSRPIHLRTLRDLLREAVDLALGSHHFDTGLSGPTLNDTETAFDLHEVRLALRLHVAHQLGEAQRELALLASLAVLKHQVDAARRRFVTRGRSGRRYGPGVQLAANLLLE